MLITLIIGLAIGYAYARDRGRIILKDHRKECEATRLLLERKLKDQDSFYQAAMKRSDDDWHQALMRAVHLAISLEG
jgi:hypothetical protein